MGFQHFRPIVHKMASVKGGKVRKPKGLAALSAERRREIASMGGKASGENKRNNKAKQENRDTSRDSPSVLEEVLGNLDE